MLIFNAVWIANRNCLKSRIMKKILKHKLYTTYWVAIKQKLTNGPHSRGCRQQDLPHQSFLWGSSHVSEPLYSRCDLSIRRSGSPFRALRISPLRTLSRSITPWTLHKDPISAACTWDSTLSVIIEGYRWGWEHRPIWKLTMVRIGAKTAFKNWQLNLRCLKAPFCDHGARPWPFMQST